MDIWHATVFYHGSAYDGDCVGREAAMRWVEQHLRDLGYNGPVNWQCTDTQCSATQSPDNTAIIRRHAPEPSQSARSAEAESQKKPNDEETGAESVNYIVRLWRGQVALPVTFWVWGVGVNFFLARPEAHLENVPRQFLE